MTALKQRLAELDEERAKCQALIRKDMAKKTIKCEACGKMHKIKDLVGVQTYWYTSPHGCTGGDYWNTGEFRFVCPETNILNRLLFGSSSRLDWRERGGFKDPAVIFRNKYKDLFKEIVEDHGEDERPWVNNYYVDKHLEKFDIEEPK